MANTVGTVVVTGGSSGIGAAIVDHLVELGHYVVVLDQRPPAATRWDVSFVQGSADDKNVASEAIAVARDSGGLAGWVNNAAHFHTGQLHELSADEFVGLVAANLAMTATGCRAAIVEYLHAERPGAIVNISSHQSSRPVRGGSVYAVAKAAIDGLTRSLAVDYGPSGIRTNSIAPGSVTGPRFHDLVQQQPSVTGMTRELHQLGRAAYPSEVATAVAFLLSPAAGFVNGVSLAVDGGRAVLGLDPEQLSL